MKRLALFLAILYFYPLCSMECSIQQDESDDEGYIFYVDEPGSDENKVELSIPSLAELLESVDSLPVELQRYITSFVGLPSNMVQTLFSPTKLLVTHNYFNFNDYYNPKSIENITPKLDKVLPHLLTGWYEHTRKNGFSYTFKMAIARHSKDFNENHQITIYDCQDMSASIYRIYHRSILYRIKESGRIIVSQPGHANAAIDIDAILDFYEKIKYGLTLRQVLFLRAIVPFSYKYIRNKLRLTHPVAIDIYENLNGDIQQKLSQIIEIKQPSNRTARKAAQAVWNKLQKR